MKIAVSIFALFIALASFGQRKVQVAILFDTSNSMDGLIDQAKSRIWGIVNEVNTYRYNGQVPLVEIALYEYGKSSLSIKDDYVRKIKDLTNDLDEISKELFALTTNGGDEFCGAVIKHSLDELKWSPDPRDLRMIYIAGNEPFTQGPVSYTEICPIAKRKNITINTIYCGEYQQGINEKWKDGATCSGGDYFNINSDNAIVHIPTPYDDQINQYNDSLNATYYGYGSLGREKKALQLSEDANAEVQSVSVKAERSKAKSSANYNNASWDILDASDKDGFKVEDIKEQDLPQEMKGLSKEEKEKFLESKKEDRAKYQEQIKELSAKRQEFIQAERAKKADETDDDFGSAVNQSIQKIATEAGYKKVEL